jgi:DNA ligase-4
LDELARAYDTDKKK